MAVAEASAPRPLKELRYTEILRLNQALRAAPAGERCEVAVLSNVVVNPLTEVLEYALRSGGIDAAVTVGDYDNIAQDSARFAGADVVVVFCELANLVDGFQYRANLMEAAELDALVQRARSEVGVALAQLRDTPLVLFNRFSSLPFTRHNLRPDAYERTARELNRYLEEAAPANVLVVDIDKVFAGVSVERSVDLRYFYSSKALYSVDFYKAYAAFVSPAVRAVRGRAKKALVFDCDNTLWKGIVGEDGLDGIRMSAGDPAGAPFEHVQHLALHLGRRGVLLGLCSKNNPADVDEVLSRHPHMRIRDDDLVVKRVNWEGKAANLAAIAEALNIGVDSLVFVDDSSFEANFVREALPDVTVLQVPERLHEYPQLLLENLGLFFNVSESREDAARAGAYREEAKRAASRAESGSLEEYLESLGLTVRVRRNPAELVPRVAQLTQKTNQFNLTTRRYTEADVARFLADDRYEVFAMSVGDRFGDYGVTGVCIAEVDESAGAAVLDTFLMSCRVIGRRVELAFFDRVLLALRERGVRRVRARYAPTPKNAQVAAFYDGLGFLEVERSADQTVYEADVSELGNHQPAYIDVVD